MKLVTSISVQNFKCYRRKTKFKLNQSNFFIGSNNAGKSAVLKAFHCFFSEDQFEIEYINKTELRSRGAGYNKSIVGITFDFNQISTKTLRGKLKNVFGDGLTLYKNWTYREATETVHVTYTIDGSEIEEDNLNDSLVDLLSRVSVSYLHPQEAKELLSQAQEKLKSRLLSNWGRGRSNRTLTEALKNLQEQWEAMRNMANTYLSAGLTESLQSIWPGCETRVVLPEKIQDIIAVSEIAFKGSSELPVVSLTSQGTGAQSTILYQTHFLLDSDKTLHRGFYYPVWLIEEPESFLHADIIFKLGALLCSKEWLGNIQMLISTHSPLLLATSRNNSEDITWHELTGHKINLSKPVQEWNDAEIKEMGIVMGDPNFDIYFKTFSMSKLIFIEDSRELTERKFKESGIDVTTRLPGIAEMRRYFNVLRAIDISMGRNIYFLVDNDDGVKEFTSVIKVVAPIEISPQGFKKFSFENNVYVILFPEKMAVEELFEEHDDVLESCANKLFNETYTAANSYGDIPANLTRAHAHVRNKSVNGIDQAKDLIRNTQDVKDIFWGKVEDQDYKISEPYKKDLLSLIS